MNELFYRFVIFAVGAFNVVLDNWLIISVIVLGYVCIRMIWTCRNVGEQ